MKRIIYPLSLTWSARPPLGLSPYKNNHDVFILPAEIGDQLNEFFHAESAGYDLAKDREMNEEGRKPTVFHRHRLDF